MFYVGQVRAETSGSESCVYKERSTLGSGSSKCKGPEAGACLLC